MSSKKEVRRQGFNTLCEYLVSMKWLRWSGDYWRRNPRNTCFACGSTDEIMLHHKSETTVGHETDDDVVPLCDTCMRVAKDRMKNGTSRHNVHLAVAKQMNRAPMKSRVRLATDKMELWHSTIPPWEDGPAS